MNKLTFALVFLVAATLANQSFACSCVSAGEDLFESVATINKQRRAESPPLAPQTVLVGKVVAQYPRGPKMILTVDVLVVLQGNLQNKRIWITGGTGADCGAMLNDIKAGEYYTLALSTYRDNMGLDRHSISGCGVFLSPAKRP